MPPEAHLASPRVAEFFHDFLGDEMCASSRAHPSALENLDFDVPAGLPTRTATVVVPILFADTGETFCCFCHFCFLSQFAACHEARCDFTLRGNDKNEREIFSRFGAIKQKDPLNSGPSAYDFLVMPKK